MIEEDASGRAKTDIEAFADAEGMDDPTGREELIDFATVDIPRLFIERLWQTQKSRLAQMRAKGSDKGFHEIDLASMVLRHHAATVAMAVLLADALSHQRDLLEALTNGSPVVTIRLPWDNIDAVKKVLKDCIFSRRTPTIPDMPAVDGGLFFICREKFVDTSPSAQTLLANAFHLGQPVIGMAENPDAFLPDVLLRAVEYRLTIPPFTPGGLHLVLETLRGSTADFTLPDEIIRQIERIDLQTIIIACRPDRSLSAMIESLCHLLRMKDAKLYADTDGPTLHELAGYGEARDWGLDLVKDLTAFRDGRLDWTEIDNRAVLLSGSPGTGKTSYAAALARTANLPLIKTSVAAWNAELFLSGTLQLMRETFRQAAKASPCVLLIDEIDGIADRATVEAHNRTYWIQIINLLLELLGDDTITRGVIIIAATNHPHRIDPALLRSGRLDRHITIEKPNPSDLAGILGYYLRTDLADADMTELATLAVGMTGADISTIVRRAKASARRAGRVLLINDVKTQLLHDRPTPDPDLPHRMAVHEIGHVIVMRVLGVATLQSVTLSSTLGKTSFDPTSARLVTLHQLENAMAMWMAGRAAEILILGEAGTGSGGGTDCDLDLATRMASSLELKTGLGQFGPLYIGDIHGIDLLRNPDLRQSISARLQQAELRALAILTENRPLLEALVSALEISGYLTSIEVDAIAAKYGRTN